ncbi:MAG: GNAT family N-acetyltransferase [Pseudomonadales bacterium]|nr:GNAT family N-acetyltransferase [Pseudomonadales bacterium]
MAEAFGIQNFLVRRADWNRDQAELSRLRRLVFIVEQGVPAEEEWDNRDAESHHWIATDEQNQTIGTARLLPEGQIGRMAVLQETRGTGVGAALLEAAVNYARELGYPSVFLNAQTHAIGFYERGGFHPVGDEFMEAGIPHLRMEQHFQDAAGNPLPHQVLGASDGLTLRNCDTREVDWEQAGKIIRTIRQQVLGVELGLDPSHISDEQDEKALHWHASAPDGQIAGCIRMSIEGEISRLAVLEAFRHQGVGHSLVEQALNKARRFGLPSVQVTSDVALQDFWISLGFTGAGAPAVAAGREVQQFRHQTEIENIAQLRKAKSGLSGTAYDGKANRYLLGEDSQFLLLRNEEDFLNAILEMTRQARQSIRIWSPVLDHRLYHQETLREIVSELARRNRYTRVDILLYDSHRVVKNGHVLLDISRRLPSSVSMKIVHPELRPLNNEFVLVDQAGVIYRQDHEQYEGFANFKDITENNRLARQFTAAWESGLQDPNLRQLKI